MDLFILENLSTRFGTTDFSLSDRKVTSETIPFRIERGVALDLDSYFLMDKEII
jgi:hypothetical protein